MFLQPNLLLGSQLSGDNGLTYGLVENANVFKVYPNSVGYFKFPFDWTLYIVLNTQGVGELVFTTEVIDCMENE